MGPLVVLAVLGLLSGIAGLCYAHLQARRNAETRARLAYYTHDAFEDDAED